MALVFFRSPLNALGGSDTEGYSPLLVPLEASSGFQPTNPRTGRSVPPSISNPDPSPPPLPAPKSLGLPLMSMAEGIWGVSLARKSKVTPSEGYGVGKEEVEHDLDEIRDRGDLSRGAKGGVVGELMRDAKKPFRNFNLHKVDSDNQSRTQFQMRAKTKIDSLLGHFRLSNAQGKNGKKNVGCICDGSGGGKDEKRGESLARTLESEMNDEANLSQVLNRKYERPRAMPPDSFNEDGDGRAKRASRAICYLKKSLSRHRTQQNNTEVRDQGGETDKEHRDNRNVRPLYDNSEPPSQQEHVDNNTDEEWRPYVPEKDDDEWEFENFMSAKPVEACTPID